MPSGLRFIRRALYKLKQRYGTSVDLYKIATTATNRTTGTRTRTYTKKTVKRALVLTAENITMFIRALSYLMAARDFTEGGFFGIAKRNFVIATKDLGDFEVTTEDYVIYAGRKYEIEKHIEYTEEEAVFLVCKETSNEIFIQIHDRVVTHIMPVSQEIA